MRPAAAAFGAGPTAVSAPHHLRVTRVGGVARRALVSERGWRVFAVFRRSFYCRSARGSLILVGPESLGAGPLHVLWSDGSGGESPRAEEGMPVGIDLDGTRVSAPEPLQLGLHEAREWTPAPPPCWTPSRLRRSLAWLERAGDRAPAEGLGRLIASVAAGEIPSDGAEGPALRRCARPAIAALSAWMRATLAPRAASRIPPEAIVDLIGLGPGLTPSGDDVLAGALLALHGFARADMAARLATWLRPRLEGRTGLVSRAHLGCAAGGEGAAVLHDAMVALASGDADALAGATAAAGTLGHCSGWDGLVGIAAVAQAWLVSAADDGERSTPCP